jgi:Cys-rich repeat protein
VRGLLLTALIFAGCGRAEVMGLGQPDAIENQDPDGGTLPVKDAEPGIDVPPGVDVPSGVDVPPGDVPVPPDAEPVDLGPIMDAETPDADTSTDADGGMMNDGGMTNDGGVVTDGGMVECTVDTDCNLQQVCDQTRGGMCRFPCFNGQCGPFGTCDPVENVCIECMQTADCDQGQVCNPNTLECVECATDADCTLDPNQNRCNEDGECVGCIADTDCPTGEECTAQAGGVCVPPTNRGLCDPCTTDDQCGGPADLCIGILGPQGIFDRSCAIDCAADPTVCPNGFACISVRNGEMQCRPSYEMQVPTCFATRNLGAACELDPQNVDPGCGIQGVQDARCESTTAGGPGQCVVWCADDADCANGTTCQAGTQGVMVCR